MMKFKTEEMTVEQAASFLRNLAELASTSGRYQIFEEMVAQFLRDAYKAGQGAHR